MEIKTSPKSTYLLQLGASIKKRRLELKMSQAEFSRRSGIHRTYISAIEKGEKNITLLSVLRIARALDITVSELLEL